MAAVIGVKDNKSSSKSRSRSGTLESNKTDSVDICDCVSEDRFSEGPITVAVDGFGICRHPVTNQPEIVKRYTFWNKNHMYVQVITYGATITSMKVPDKYGKPEDVIMGFETIGDYQNQKNPYIGATIGRVCQRISNGRFCLDEKRVKLDRNENGVHHFNGGCRGFDKYNWVPHLEGTTLTLNHYAEEEIDGYPGNVMVTATFQLTHDNSFQVSYSASTSKPTPLNLTQALYINLAGHGSGFRELYKHIVTLNGDKHVVVNEDSIPTGKIQCVGGTVYDLRIPHELGPAISRCPTGGYDTTYGITAGTEQTLTFVGRIVHPKTGRVLEMYTDQPAFQFYTGNYLPDPFDDINPPEVYSQDFYELPGANTASCVTESLYVCAKNKKLLGAGDGNGSITLTQDLLKEMSESCTCSNVDSCSCTATLYCECTTIEEPLIGKRDALYMRHGAFCLMSQGYPDAVNQPFFPTVIIRPGETYKHEVIYKFGIHKGVPPPIEPVGEEGEEENEEEANHEEDET